MGLTVTRSDETDYCGSPSTSPLLKLQELVCTYLTGLSMYETKHECQLQDLALYDLENNLETKVPECHPLLSGVFTAEDGSEVQNLLQLTSNSEMIWKLMQCQPKQYGCNLEDKLIEANKKGLTILCLFSKKFPKIT
ncbi:unnamed protein product [Cylicocyclus nassatus]|uniref:Uncharacterized protein n=1 Tax=Cylicocyclus nassatus TaxID=53992 RepID=A0AA36GP54_CYLNA|nr:unnamed protein product [Cylicocyclus nassatus]